MNIPFQPGKQKIINPRLEKDYHPFLYRLGQRRYAHHGQLTFYTATAALEYALRWAARADRILSIHKESGIVS